MFAPKLKQGDKVCVIAPARSMGLISDEVKNTILMLEDDNLTGDISLQEFNRNLQSLIHCRNFSKVRGIIIGRFQLESKVKKEQLYKMIKTKKELSSIPVAANFDFGHTTPIACLPIGGSASLNASGGKCSLVIIRH